MKNDVNDVAYYFLMKQFFLQIVHFTEFIENKIKAGQKQFILGDKVDEKEINQWIQFIFFEIILLIIGIFYVN